MTLDSLSCRFKDYVKDSSIRELLAEEEVLKTTDLLTQAKLSELAARQEEKLEPASEVPKKEEENDKLATSPETASGATAPDGPVAMDIDKPVKEQENEPQPSDLELAAIPIEGDQQKLESGNELEPDVQIKVEPQVKQDSSAEGVEDTTEITDEEVKAYWLSGIAALHQVNLLSVSLLEPSDF